MNDVLCVARCALAIAVAYTVGRGQATVSSDVDAVKACHWVASQREFTCEYTLQRTALVDAARLESEHGIVLREYLGTFECRLVMAEHRWYASRRSTAANGTRAEAWYDGQRYVNVPGGGAMVSLYDNVSLLGPHGPKLMFADAWLSSQDVEWSSVPRALGSSVHLGPSWDGLRLKATEAGRALVSGSDEFRLDASARTVESWSRSGPDGRAWETQYSDYRRVGRVSVPMRIVTRFFVLREHAERSKPSSVPLVEESIVVARFEGTASRAALRPQWPDQLDVIDARTGAARAEGDWFRIVSASASPARVEAAADELVSSAPSAALVQWSHTVLMLTILGLVAGFVMVRRGQ